MLQPDATMVLVPGPMVVLMRRLAIIIPQPDVTMVHAFYPEMLAMMATVLPWVM
jgi:hypothetical protein